MSLDLKARAIKLETPGRELRSMEVPKLIAGVDHRGSTREDEARFTPRQMILTIRHGRARPL